MNYDLFFFPRKILYYAFFNDYWIIVENSTKMLFFQDYWTDEDDDDEVVFGHEKNRPKSRLLTLFLSLSLTNERKKS